MKTCICDKCGKEIEMNVQEEVIDQDKDGKDITELLIDCRLVIVPYAHFINTNHYHQQNTGCHYNLFHPCHPFPYLVFSFSIENTAFFTVTVELF